jgi:hypothetical protein
MLTSFNFKQPYLFNKTISDYCKNSTNESIKKITDKYNLERRNITIINPFNNEYEDDNKSKITMYSILVFLSISTIGFFFYKRIK